jgi:hypothetical protein
MARAVSSEAAATSSDRLDEPTDFFHEGKQKPRTSYAACSVSSTLPSGRGLATETVRPRPFSASVSSPVCSDPVGDGARRGGFSFMAGCDGEGKKGEAGGGGCRKTGRQRAAFPARRLSF